ncbi:hypothetical protein ABZX77_05810 [Streptomyces sp. NPDC004237]|uniref:hypothetical protein n=1 Tax=Streptomyces sp. NPDC004237 TaxID=3154455 RepID=UPI0033B32D85
MMSESISFGRPFVLRRDRDLSGVSGTGIIADGVLFPDGQAAIHWRGKWALTTPHPDGIDSIMDIHDHGGRGELHVIWPERSGKGREILSVAVGRAYALADRWQAAHGSANILVRAAGTELRDELDDSGAAAEEVVRSEGNEQVDGLSGVDYVAAAECSAQHHGFPGDHRQCIRAAQHRGDHIDEHGFHWSDLVAMYPIVDGRLKCGRASTIGCSTPEHACKICGDCMYEHPGEGGCVDAPLRRRSGGELEELADVVRTVLGIDVRAAPADVSTWLLTACRQLEKSEDARRRLRGQRDTLAQALREVLADFHAVTAGPHREVLVYQAASGVHPSNFSRWRAALVGLPENCARPGGCADCPHEQEA